MERWDLQIELKSDFCTATGESSPGRINCKTALECGIPYIPAKRIKGCLLESGREMAEHGLIDQNLLYRLFGRPGQAGGEGLCIGDGQLCSVPGYLFEQEKKGQVAVSDYEQLRMMIGERPDLDHVLLESIFTRTRTRTALDETGTAKQHSLRTIQVVPAGIIFTSQLEGNLSEEERCVLADCVKGLRHMGVGISRGLGEVRCTLTPVKQKIADVQSNDTAFLHTLNPEEEVQISYKIKLDQPVVISEGTADSGSQIPGSAVLGALAGMYIKKHSLGEKAHEDENFRRIFLRDGVQFGYAFLMQDEIKYGPCPKALFKSKENEGRWFNILNHDSNERRRKISGQVFLEDGKLYTVHPQKEVRFHHARPVDRGIGHALNDRAADTSSPTGQFFQYMALSKGQTFAGTWKGMAADMIKLVECLEEYQYRLKLGKSRTAEYGSCVLRIADVRLAGQQRSTSARSNEWFVWLLSPLVFNHSWEESSKSRRDMLLVQMMKDIGCVEVKSVCDDTVLDGYNSRWKLPAAAYPALAAGSAFYIRTSRDIAAWEIEEKRWGMVTGKGCGQVKAELWNASRVGDIVPESAPAHEKGQPKEAPAGVNKELLDAVLKHRDKCLEEEDTAQKALAKIDGLACKLPSLSEISLLLQLLQGGDADPGSYTDVINKMKQISGDEKKNRIMAFIKPCANESLLFMKKYLEAAKWKARRANEYE